MCAHSVALKLGVIAVTFNLKAIYLLALRHCRAFHYTQCRRRAMATTELQIPFCISNAQLTMKNVRRTVRAEGKLPQLARTHAHESRRTYSHSHTWSIMMMLRSCALRRIRTMSTGRHKINTPMSESARGAIRDKENKGNYYLLVNASRALRSQRASEYKKQAKKKCYLQRSEKKSDIAGEDEDDDANLMW